MIPNGEIVQQVVTDDTRNKELAEVTELLDEAFDANKISISWIYIVHDLLVRYKCLTGREYEIKIKEDTIV